MKSLSRAFPGPQRNSARLAGGLLLLVACSVLATARQAGPPVPVLRRWIAAVLTHHPGEIDQALQDVAAMPATTFKALIADLETTLRQDFRDRHARDDVRRRGALLHTDIALLLPDLAAAFKPSDAVTPPRSSELDRMGRPVAKPATASLDYLVDGRYIASDVESGHWPFAAQLLAGIMDASSDEFVRLWYRAVAATFLREYRLGNATFHIQRAKEVLPRDPIMLFYAGALQETLASGRVRQSYAVPTQKLESTMGRFTVSDAEAPTATNLLAAAERNFRDAVKYGAPAEAQLRLGRITGLLGKHAEAVNLLTGGAVPALDGRLAYLRELFLGTEYEALGRSEDAGAAFHRAAALSPTAQSPLIALSDLMRRSGNRAGAVDAVRRLEALPAEPSERADPWWDYHRSYAADASEQLAAVRSSVDLRKAR